MQFYNVHSHVFNMRNAPKRFLNLYLPDVAANLIDKLTNTQFGSKAFGVLLSKLGGNGGKRYASFLQVGKSRNQLEIFENLKSQYDDPHLKLVALTMYMEECGAGPSETGFEGQLEGVLEVKKVYPDNLLVFLGIDPRWKGSGTELKLEVERYFDTKLQINAERSVNPFVGLKIYPSMGFYVFDEKLKETFEWAAERGIPVLSHCSYLGGIYSNDTDYIANNLNPNDIYSGKKYADTFPAGTPPPAPDRVKGFFKWLLGRRENARNLNTCSYFMEPASFRTFIDYFSRKARPLKICFAHFGGDDHILADSSGQNPDSIIGMDPQNWCSQIKQLIRQYPNVYTDIAYALANPAVHDPIFKDLSDADFATKIMFGTDFFLTERELPEKADYATFKKRAVDQPFGNTNAWEILASRNIETFLKSDYYG